MTDPQIAIMMLGLFIFVVLLGFPIAFTLIAMGLGFGYYAYFDPMRMKSLFDNRIFDLVRAEYILGDVERCAGGGPTLPIYGLRGGTGQHR